MKPDNIGRNLVKMDSICKELGLKVEGNGFYSKGEYKFDLTASGYEYKHILKNILNQLPNG